MLPEIAFPEKIDLIWIEFNAQHVKYQLEQIKEGKGDIDLALAKINTTIELVKKSKKNAEDWRSVVFQIANKIN